MLTRHMRIFTAGLITETNTFAPLPTGMAGFVEGGLYRGDASEAGSDTANVGARTFRDLAAADGHAFAEGLFATADPSGPTLAATYETLRDEILADAAARGPFDVVLLFLHGAMVAVGYEDCEADLTQRLRHVVGPSAVIGVELDPHCHLGQALLDVADCVVLMKEYPHIDYADRAGELYAICTRAAAGAVRPTAALFDCRMIGFYPTTPAPMAGLLQRMREAEQRPGVLSVSFAHGFPWGDTPETGSKMLVVTDGDAALAAAIAEELGLAVYRERQALLPRLSTMAAALDAAMAVAGPVVLADTADNPGGGAPGDNVAFLRLLLERGIGDAALGCIWDPMAVRMCAEAGLGARFMLRIGGKTGAASGSPLDTMVTVQALSAEHDEAGLGDSRASLGAAARIACAGIDVVLVSKRVQTFAPDAFTGLGIDLATKRIVVVKSSQHYRARFAAFSRTLIDVATPGAIQMDFAAIDYRRRQLAYFPRHPDPLGCDAAGGH